MGHLQPDFWHRYEQERRRARRNERLGRAAAYGVWAVAGALWALLAWRLFS